MSNNFIRHVVIGIFILTCQNLFAQYPYPVIAHYDVESELLARAGNKLLMYDAYVNKMFTSDSTNLALLHSFGTNSNSPTLYDYQSTTNYLYMTAIVHPLGFTDYFLIYKTDGITLDTLFMYSSSNTITPPLTSLASYNDTLYFLQRDSLMMADDQGTITNIGYVPGSGTLWKWNDKMVNVSYGAITIFDIPSQSFAPAVNLVDANNASFYRYPVFNNWLLYCDSGLKYFDPVTLTANLIDSTFYYREVIGILNNKIICFAEDKAGLYGGELYAVDITTHQPTLIKDINPGTLFSFGNSLGLAVQAAHYIYFYADDGVHGMELWITDGTTGGTHMIIDYNPGTDGESPYNYTYSCQRGGYRVNDYAYVVGDTLITGMHPTNGSALAQFAVTNGTQFNTIDMSGVGSPDEFMKYFTEFKGNVYFTTEITPSPWGHLCRFNTSVLTGIFSLNEKNTIEIFPNPTLNTFTIDLKKVYTRVSIKIMNTMGQVTGTSDFFSISKATLDLTGDAGVYYVQVTANDTSRMIKITKY